MASRTIGMTETLHTYLLSVSGPVHAVAEHLRQETQKLPQAEMQISVEQGHFMSFLIKLLQARKTLEVGVFTGYSTLIVALALPDDGRIVACDVSEEWTRIGKAHWEQAGVTHKIDLRIAPAMQTLDTLLTAGEAGTFDFAFIDADKSNYDAYYERALQLIRPGGVIAIDNTLWAGRVADPQVQDADTVALRDLNAKLCQDPRVTVSLLPVGDGLTLVLKH